MMTTTNTAETFDSATKCTTPPSYLIRLSPSTVDHVSICVLYTHQTDCHPNSNRLEMLIMAKTVTM